MSNQSGSVAESATLDNPRPSAAPAAPPPAAPPPAAPPPAAAPAAKPEGAAPEERAGYVPEGRFKRTYAENQRLTRENAEMARLLEELRATPRAPDAPAAPAKPAPLSDDQFVELMLTKPSEARRLMREEVETAVLEKARGEVQGQFTQRQVADQRIQAFRTIFGMPEAKQGTDLNENGISQGFQDEVDAIGREYPELLASIHPSGGNPPMNPMAAARMVMTVWRAAKALETAAAAAPAGGEPGKTGAPSVDKAAATALGGSTAPGGGGAKSWTGAEVEKLSMDNPEEFRKQWPAIEAAWKAGKIKT